MVRYLLSFFFAQFAAVLYFFFNLGNSKIEHSGQITNVGIAKISTRKNMS